MDTKIQDRCLREGFLVISIQPECNTLPTTFDEFHDMRSLSVYPTETFDKHTNINADNYDSNDYNDDKNPSNDVNEAFDMAIRSKYAALTFLRVPVTATTASLVMQSLYLSR